MIILQDPISRSKKRFLLGKVNSKFLKTIKYEGLSFNIVFACILNELTNFKILFLNYMA